MRALIAVLVCGGLGLGCGASAGQAVDPAPREGEGGAGGQGTLGDAGEGASTAGGGPVVCGDQTSVRTARRARSSGFSGSEEDYFALYDEPCEEASDCFAVCEAAGGEQALCEATECVEEFEAGRSCLPAPVWRNLDNILFEGTTPLDAVEITLVDSEYHDTLLTDDFRHEVPSEARILGITAEVRRSGDRAADYSVRILKRGASGSAERALPEMWTPDLTWLTYGDEEDLWGETWEPEDVMAEDFGVAIALVYTHDSGNSRAYVDQVRTTVFYRVDCE